MAHGQIAVVLQEPHHVHVGHADAGLDETARTSTPESRDHVVDAGGDPLLWSSLVDSCLRVNCSHHLDNVSNGNDRVNMDELAELVSAG